jgi:hypothetical protein
MTTSLGAITIGQPYAWAIVKKGQAQAGIERWRQAMAPSGVRPECDIESSARRLVAMCGLVDVVTASDTGVRA